MVFVQSIENLANYTLIPLVLLMLYFILIKSYKKDEEMKRNSSKMTERSVSLVLGSGGARGLAHIGVIRYLEENGYEIKSISGCSMGAHIGGFYAAGKLDVYSDWLIGLDAFGMVKLLDFKGSGGLVSGETL